MSLIDDYAFSLRVTDNVLSFIYSAGERWSQPPHVLLFGDIFPKEKSLKVSIITTKIEEYNSLKKDIFIELDELLSKIQADKNSPEIKVNELMNIRNSIHSVREKIIATSEKFSYLQSISLWDFLYSDEIEKALFDFSHTEIHLFIRIQEELTIILGDWLLSHQYELSELDKEISELSIKETYGGEIFELQSVRLKTYIKSMQEYIKGA